MLQLRRLCGFNFDSGLTDGVRNDIGTVIALLEVHKAVPALTVGMNMCTCP